MSERAVYIRVGLLIIAGLALGFGLIWFLGGERIGRAETVESYFVESVQGLEVGAPVKYRGVTLGRVTEMGLVSAEYRDQAQVAARTYRLVFVRYVIDAEKAGRAMDTANAVNLGLRVRLASQGITGLSYLELDFVNPAEHPVTEVPWQPKVSIIPSIPSTLIQVQNAAQQVLAKLNGVDIDGVVAALTGLIGDLRQQVAQGDAHQAMRQIAALGQTLQQSVRGADLPGLAADLRQTSAALRDTVQGPEMRRTLAGVEQAATGLARAAAQFAPLVAELRATTRRAGDSTADLQQALVPLLRDLQATAQNLRETTDMLRRYPAQMFGQPPPRPPERAP